MTQHVQVLDYVARLANFEIKLVQLPAEEFYFGTKDVNGSYDGRLRVQFVTIKST